ncbi:hypothetical protein ETI09_06430 [Macrococcoides canis]|uniref:Ig-like domain-containing protein n=1 Tax=Macrococcoides canis TaxID=1855823 RepID=UPI00105E05B0|nr:Ig-like domain-containing protein [Macrococcus canis]TDM44012.1 hypothetical protein ETI09_06430 [Macrococcus canis]
MDVQGALANIDPQVKHITVDKNKIGIGDKLEFRLELDEESSSKIQEITLYFFNMESMEIEEVTLKKQENNIYAKSFEINEDTNTGYYYLNQIKYKYSNGEEIDKAVDYFTSFGTPYEVYYNVAGFNGNVQITELSSYPNIARPGETVSYELKFNEDTSNNISKLYLELMNESNKKIQKINMIEQAAGKYIGRMGVTQNTDSGKWNLNRIIGETIQGEKIYIDYYNAHEVIKNSYSVNFMNISTEVTHKRLDKYPPIVDSISVNNSTFKEGDTITYTVKAHDEDGNGIKEDSAILSVIHEDTGTYEYVKLFEKSPGVYISNKEVLSTDLKGKWKFNYLSLYDKLGNNTFINSYLSIQNFEYTIGSKEERPTTEQPTTERPTTEQPTTEQPTTERPTTERPTTEQPTTEQLTTERPTTERPTTEQPTTEQPTTEQPTTERPTTERPTTERPTTEQPTTEQPTTERPTTEQPTTERPTTERTTTEQPTTERPVAKPPVKQVVVKSPTLNEKSVTDKSTSISGVSNSNGTVYVLSNNKVIGKANVVNGKFKVNFKPVKAGSTLTIYTELNKLKSKSITIKVKKAPIKKITVATPVINQKYISNKTTSISGSSKSNGTVYVLANNKVIGKANVSKGKFKVRFKAIAAGKNVSVYTVQNKVKSKYVNFKVVDKIAPKPPVVNKVTTRSMNVTGRGEKNAQVTVYKGKTLIAKSAVNNKGKFALKINKQKKNTVLHVYLMDKSKNKSKPKSIKVS